MSSSAFRRAARLVTVRRARFRANPVEGVVGPGRSGAGFARPRPRRPRRQLLLRHGVPEARTRAASHRGGYSPGSAARPSAALRAAAASETPEPADFWKPFSMPDTFDASAQSSLPAAFSASATAKAAASGLTSSGYFPAWRSAMSCLTASAACRHAAVTSLRVALSRADTVRSVAFAALLGPTIARYS